MSKVVPLKGFGTGGNILNFNVVGNPQPSSAAKNTIWVNTDTPITCWFFSATEPENKVEGMIWFCIGTSSKVSFNALKKNGIQVYPISAKQYISGSWVGKEVQVNQDGWHSFITSLYDNGDECVDNSGGFTAYAYRMSGVKGEGGAISTAPTLTKGTSSMTISFMQVKEGSSTTGAVYYPGAVFADDAVDLTGVSEITVKVSSFSRTASKYGNSTYCLQIANSKSDGYTVEASVDLTSDTSFMLDVSALSGMFYLAVGVRECYGAGTLGISEIKYQ